MKKIQCEHSGIEFEVECEHCSCYSKLKMNYDKAMALITKVAKISCFQMAHLDHEPIPNTWCLACQAGNLLKEIEDENV